MTLKYFVNCKKHNYILKMHITHIMITKQEQSIMSVTSAMLQAVSDDETIRIAKNNDGNYWISSLNPYDDDKYISYQFFYGDNYNSSSFTVHYNIVDLLFELFC